MLYPEKVLAALAAKRDALTGYQRTHGQNVDAYRTALAQLTQRFPSAAAIDVARDLVRRSHAEEAGTVGGGAHATAEYDTWRAQGGTGIPRLRFGTSFANHEEARAWAERVRGTAALAVDGSHLMPWRDASLPLALVQAGIFENPHQPPQPYVKEAVLEVLTPDDLLPLEETVESRAGEEMGYSEKAVALRRFELETRTLAERLATHPPARRDGAATDALSALAFSDGSLMVPFALKMPGPYRERYLDAIERLLDASRWARVPLVGYIDTSYARDVTRLLAALFPELPPSHGVHDALLWSGRLGWGERSPAFVADRADHSILAGKGRSAKGSAQRAAEDVPTEEVAFVLFQAALDRPPARVEFPRWVLDAGLLDAVIDVVRAEVIAGNGYPYPIEAADAVAVISMEDRARFYALLQQFAEREGIPLTFSRKALSKSRRRV